MRKSLAFILSFVYLFTFTGVTVHRHFCMGRQAGWDLFRNRETACPVCGMEKKDAGSGCCKDEFLFFKVSADQQPSGVVVCTYIPEVAVLPPVCAKSGLCKSVQLLYTAGPAFTGSPGISPPFTILHSVFRI